MIVLRIGAGIKEHFPFRWPEWGMTYAILGFSVALAWQPDMFSVSPSFRAMADIASEVVWGAILFIAGFLRLAALVVNGTFKDAFPYSPQIRALTAALCATVWGSITLAFVASYINDGGALSGFVIYSAATLLDIGCFYRATLDTGKALKKVR